jgi:hypothetical protein
LNEKRKKIPVYAEGAMDFAEMFSMTYSYQYEHDCIETINDIYEILFLHIFMGLSSNCFHCGKSTEIKKKLKLSCSSFIANLTGNLSSTKELLNSRTCMGIPHKKINQPLLHYFFLSQ